MRSLRKSFVVIVLLTVMLLTTACIPTDEAKTQGSELLSCLGDGDYEKAASYMHPDFAITSDLMQSTFEEYLKLGADLSLGIEKISYNSIESSYYDSSEYSVHLYISSSCLFGFNHPLGKCCFAWSV